MPIGGSCLLLYFPDDAITRCHASVHAQTSYRHSDVRTFADTGTVSPDGRLLAVGGCSKPLEADLRSGSVFCTGTDSKSPGGVPFLLILDANTEAGVGTVPENQPDTTVSDLAFTPDGKKLWRAGEHGNLTAWDTSEWNLLAENVGGVTPIFNLHEFQFTGDGRHYLLFSDLLIGLYGLP